MKRGGPLQRKTPLRSMGRKQLRERDALNGFRRVIWERSGGMCEAHTPACAPGAHVGGHCHHLAPSDRDKGLHNPDRGLMVCPTGHAFIHNEPALSYEMGWLLRDGVA